VGDAGRVCIAIIAIHTLVGSVWVVYSAAALYTTVQIYPYMGRSAPTIPATITMVAGFYILYIYMMPGIIYINW